MIPGRRHHDGAGRSVELARHHRADGEDLVALREYDGGRRRAQSDGLGERRARAARAAPFGHDQDLPRQRPPGLARSDVLVSRDMDLYVDLD